MMQSLERCIPQGQLNKVASGLRSSPCKVMYGESVSQNFIPPVFRASGRR